MNDPYQQLRASPWASLAKMAWQRLREHPHGDVPTWLDAIAQLPGGDGCHQLDQAMPVLGRAAEDAKAVRGQLMRLHPWRKGPLQLAGVKIDTEWRSDWKWQRVGPHLELDGHTVLDIGSGNGYFGLRMLAHGARRVIGVDPTLVFVMQWLAMRKLCPGIENYVLPLGVEDLPDECEPFDTVFSMGVLYHRRDPERHLQKLKSMSRPGGQVVLETLVLDTTRREVLQPEGRYARMRNVHAIPSLPVLLEWLAESGMGDNQVLDVSATTLEEQRTTRWMKFESLAQCLDPDDPSLTVEGYPAPVRAAVLIRI
ncbi:MAG: tRNA 5-methoxyuridine(34)/uridine 5-oxyacetic acid(34) synthase CmoB [Lysobacterales bacterium]